MPPSYPDRTRGRRRVEPPPSSPQVPGKRRPPRRRGERGEGSGRKVPRDGSPGVLQVAGGPVPTHGVGRGGGGARGARARGLRPVDPRRPNPNGLHASAVALADQLCRLHLGQMQPMPMARLASSDEKLRPLHVGQTQAQVVPAPPVLPASPAEKHAAIPKSTSIRSKGYLKHRVTKPVNVGSQRVFVGVDGAKAEEHKDGSDGGEKGGQVPTAPDAKVWVWPLDAEVVLIGAVQHYESRAGTQT